MEELTENQKIEELATKLYNCKLAASLTEAKEKAISIIAASGELNSQVKRLQKEIKRDNTKLEEEDKKIDVIKAEVKEEELQEQKTIPEMSEEAESEVKPELTGEKIPSVDDLEPIEEEKEVKPEQNVFLDEYEGDSEF